MCHNQESNSQSSRTPQPADQETDGSSSLQGCGRQCKQDHGEALAGANGCSPAGLLGRGPGAPDATAEIVDIWEHIKPGDREVARRVLRSLGQSDA